MEEFFRTGWVRVVLPPPEPPGSNPWDHPPWNGNVEAYREDLYGGMAESTLAVSFSYGLSTEWIDGAALWAEGWAQPADANDPEAVEIVSCGRKFEGHDIKTVSTEKPRVELPERRVGEILIKGPSVTPGYFGDAKKTRETITSRGWLKTGDLGYLTEDGQVFICGRLKDLIIIYGTNYYPQDLEWAASKVKGVRYGDVVAFSAQKAELDREAVVIVAAAKKAAPKWREELKTEIKQEVQRATGLAVDEVVIAKTGAVPKTLSGKVQRHKAKALYEAGELRDAEQEEQPALLPESPAARPRFATRRPGSRPARSPASWSRSKKATDEFPGARHTPKRLEDRCEQGR